MDKFLEMYNLPRLDSVRKLEDWIQEEIENKNRPISSNKIESVTNSTKTNVQDQTASQRNSIKHLKKT